MSFGFIIKKAVPWALALSLPVACASHGELENVGEQSSALTTTIGLDADAYVASASPSTNYGSATTLLADGSPVLETYVRFTVPTLSNITNVKLRLRVVDTTNGTY